MLALVSVKCPHCGAEGQIMLPPMGSIIVGPCPECDEMVVVFCGRVLPLEKELMTSGSAEEKRDHLLETLGLFLKERIEMLLHESEPGQLTGDDLGQPSIERQEAEAEEAAVGPTPISLQEFASFVQEDLKQLDDREVFKRIFG